MDFKIRKYLLSLIFLLIFGCVNAQINLELNDILFIEFSHTIPAGTVLYTSPLDTTITVPTGKVYKIESMGPSLNGAYTIILNDVMIGASTSISFPLWLKEGTYTIKVVRSSSGTTSSDAVIKVFFSGLEFNKN